MSPDVHLTPQQRAARRVGRTVLKWRLDALLGVGGTAAVYAATHHNRSRVALKILHRELAAHDELRARFLREAYVANSVGHEGAVQVLDDQLSEEGEPVLIMPLLEGTPLDALQAARGVLPVEEALGHADRILEVLAAAHARGIVHRDIKPQNVFITTSGAVKVLDFGVARLLDGTATMTATGALVGTPAFMPPEQAGGRTAEIGPQSDLWSVAATVFNLLTGRFVHEAPNVQQHTVKAAVTPARSIASLRPDLPAAVAAWVDRGLSFDIARRFQSAEEMREALARVRAGLAAPPPPLPDPGTGRPGAPMPASGAVAPRAPEPPSVPVPHGGPVAPSMPAPHGGPVAPSVPVPPSMPVPPGGPVAPSVPVPPSMPVPHGGQAPHGGPVPPSMAVPPGGQAPPQDAAAIARAHGLPPPAPKRELSRAEKGGIAAVAVGLVVVVGLVARGLAGRGAGPEQGGSGSAGARPAGTDLSVWLGSSTAQDPSADPEAPEAPAGGTAAPAGTGGFVAEEGRAALEAAEAEALRCARKLGPRGRMSVQVTFHPDGTTTAQVEIAFSRTPVGICVEEAYRSRARVKPFEGPAITVTRMVHLPG